MLELSLLTSAFGVLTCMRGAGAFLGPPLAGFVLDAAGPRTDMGNSTIVDDPASVDVVGDVSGIIMIKEQRSKNIFASQVEGSDLTGEMTTMEPPTKEDLAHYEVSLHGASFFLHIKFHFSDCSLHLNSPFGHFCSRPWVCLLCKQSAEKSAEEAVHRSMNSIGLPQKSFAFANNVYQGNTC